MPAQKKSAILQANSIGILPLQEAVLFPNTVIPLAVVKKPGIQLVEEALREGKPIGLTVLKDAQGSRRHASLYRRGPTGL
jgi:ATP-dependent Lon protease